MNNTDSKNEEDIVTYNTFEDMPIKENLLRGILNYGFEKPSSVQSKGIIPVVNGNDSIIQAQSGCGKTATFSIASLQLVDAKKNFVKLSF